ncbi:hypothetical protein COHA_000927 [Chlorella ohadii]|uniref:Fe2OG dioxygenase domain-containing protein n=1 Tax=Chlorella ohadii TaxID=2649997 RepID=A0AAD5E2J9_9CHLO|nr:hypothetical protein COHA_000927 [Chlorella ohadii]
MLLVYSAVADHGVPEQLLDDTMAAQRAFFSLPLEQKMRIAVNKYYRGYTPMAEETLDPSRSRRGDTHEGIYYGRHVEEGSEEAKLPLHGPNQWPDEALVPGYRAATEAYWEATAAVGFRLLRLLGLSLGLGAGALFSALLYAAHDCTATAALQICTDGATWRGVDPLPGCFIVNIGDMLCRWTNGRYKSTLHRVVNTTGRERYSLPLFFEPNFDALVVALDSCVEEGQAPLFPPITAGEHLLERYHATHAGYGKAAAEQAAAAAGVDKQDGQ